MKLAAGKVTDEQYAFLVEEARKKDPHREKPNFAPVLREAIDLLMQKRGVHLSTSKPKTVKKSASAAEKIEQAEQQ